MLIWKNLARLRRGLWSGGAPVVASSVLDLIGNTPLVRINNFGLKDGVEIYAKLEMANPSGSIKDRIALRMIEQAENNGELTKGKTIIEASSGNTGIGLAMVGRLKGYDVVIVLSEAVSVERRKVLRALGAEVVLTDKNKGTDGAIVKVRELAEKFPDKYFNPNQFSNEYNKLAHYEGTAREIWEQTSGRVTHFVSALGTSGTLMGTGVGLKKRNENVKIVEAHPVRGHYIQGLKNMEEAIVPAIYDSGKIDVSVRVDSEEAFEMAREVVRREGILVGMSSGAAMVAALDIAKRIESGVIVVIFPDGGEKYLSTELFG